MSSEHNVFSGYPVMNVGWKGYRLINVYYVSILAIRSWCDFPRTISWVAVLLKY